MLKSRSIIFRGHSSIRSIRRPYGTSNVAKNWKLILGYTVFTTTFTGAALVVTAVGEYELVRRQRGFMNNPMNSYRRKMWLGPPGQEEFKLRERMGDWFRSLVPTQTAFLVIIAVNIGILLAWKRAVYNRELSNKMFKWFTLRNSSKPITLLTSTFSHSSALHLFINMYCLWTFLPTMDSSYGLIRTLAIFFTGCVCSSYVNVLYKLIRGSTIPSVGASGGILAVVTAMAEIFPDIRLTFIIPVVAFDASTGVIGITALSVCGIIFKKILPSIDHVAHLAGIAYGYVWHRYIHTFYVTHSKTVKSKWRQFRERKY
ncbi:Presenilins-associated rhomboid-like protein, mitochondrial-like [Oopsacas minuta]|uniref:rhomboid protease n=1 Tax=Oopsacas minuta TaxID=111878 RepID=A0AAV7JAP0_9METZ|nr:Presenilins-associated rhomboid-like protein, mitochondrial-like [Oopsacas minuta]